MFYTLVDATVRDHVPVVTVKKVFHHGLLGRETSTTDETGIFEGMKRRQKGTCLNEDKQRRI